jgi:WD40 repeat protein
MLRSSKRKRCDSEQVSFTIAPCPSEQDHFRRALNRLYEEGRLCDVCFRVRGVLFNAHKVVLVAASAFLGALVSSGMSESMQEIIDLDADPALFKHLLNYTYGQSIEVSSTQLIALLGSCNAYSMMGLRDRLAELLINTLSVENCCSILSAADAFDCIPLKEQALRVLFANFAATAKTQAFLDLPQSLLEQVIASDDILDCDEALMFEAAVRWISFQLNTSPSPRNAPIFSPEGGEELCNTVLSLIRFPLMDSCYLSDVIKSHRFMGVGRAGLLMEAFEHHALLAAGRPGVTSTRTRKRKQSCSFTRSRALDGHGDAVSAVLVLGDFLVSGSWDSTIKVWSMDSWTCVRTLSDHAGAIRSLCACADKLVSCSDDGTLKVWSPGSWTCVRSMEGHDGTANVVIACRGRLASGGDDGTVKLWSTATYACEVTVHHTAEGRNTHVDDDDEEEEEEEGDEGPEGQRVGVLSLEVFEDKLISGGDDAVVRVWNTNTWSCERTFRAHSDEVWTLKRFGAYLITGSVDGTIKVWKPSSPVPLSRSASTSALLEVCASSSSQEAQHGNGNGEGSSSSSNQHDREHEHDHQHAQSSSQATDWVCEHTITSDGPVYVLCCLDNKVVSAGSSSRISVWKPPLRCGQDEDWALHTFFETEQSDVWALTQTRGKLISGSMDGVIRVWV